MSAVGGSGETVERFGHQVRQYPLAVSATALALAWARQEDGPQGATVVAEREVSPLGRHGKLWAAPAATTLTCAIVLRPKLAVEEGDLAWLIAALAVVGGAEAVSGRTLATWWPDKVVEPDTGQLIAHTKAEVQLGPGQVRSAVITMRVDLGALGLEAGRRDDALEALLAALDQVCLSLDEGAAAVAAAYEGRCQLLGKRMKITLLPKGETRGVARRIDRTGALELESSTGMVERVAIDALRNLEVV